MFAQAQQCYDQFQLRRVVAGEAQAVMPVTQEQLEAQQQQIQRDYLSFPLSLSKVHVVDSLSSLQHAAKVLGVSLKFDLPLQTVAAATTADTAPDAAGDASADASAPHSPSHQQVSPPSPSPGPSLSIDAATSTGKAPLRQQPLAAPQHQHQRVAFSDLMKHLRVSNSINDSNNSSSIGGASTATGVTLRSMYRLLVGLDGEWKVEMFRNNDHLGCSILQV